MRRKHGASRYFRSLIAAPRAQRPAWRALGAVVATAALGAKLATPVYAGTVEAPFRPGEPATHTIAAIAREVDVVAWRFAAASPRQSAASQAPAAAPVRFDIAEGPVETVIAAFTAATGIRVEVAGDAIRNLTSPGLSGSFTAAEALARLLEGTGLAHRFTSPGSAIVEVRVSGESVQVTGRLARVESSKYPTPLSSTPQTIQVIPRSVMEQQGVTTLSEALRNVPGITLQAGEGGGASSTTGDMFSMRGFSANNSLFVDGVRDDGLLSRDTFNLEQVEVFMGPTGTDVGRGTAAGYVNMVTKAPRLSSATSATYQYGSGDQNRLAVDLNQATPFGEEGSWTRGTAFRINALWQDSGVPGRDHTQNERKSVAPSIALGLGTPFRIVASGQFMRQDNLPDYGMPAAAWDEALNLVTPAARASQPVDQSNFYGSVDYDYDDVAQDSYLARAEYDITPTMTLRNQARFNKTHRAAVVSAISSANSFNPATEEVTVARQGNERENKIFANQTSLLARAGSGQVRHAISAGVEFLFEDQFAPALTGFGVRQPASIYNPDAFAPVTDFNVRRTGAFTDGSTDTVGFYAFDTVSLGSRWQLNGGLRVERYETDYMAVDATGATTTDLSASDTLVSGKAGVVYQINAQGNVYVSYGSNVTPPGTANFTLSTQDNNLNNPNVEPQRSTNFEVGSKWDVAQGRLSTAVAVFRTKNSNVIYTIDSTAVPPIFNQDDGQIVRGVTVGVTGQPLPGWQVMSSLAYLDTELETQNVVNDGRRLTLTPQWSGSLWTTYTLPIRLVVGGGVRFQGETYFNAANSLRAPSYQIVDGLVEYPVNRHLTLRLNLYNLGDAEYVRNINNNGGRYNPRIPRSAAFSANVGF